jgi:hypothetical protein
MVLLRRLEEALKAALEAPFAQLFPQTVQPLEMAAALREAMEASRLHTPDGSFAHNDYRLRLSLDDQQALASAITSLERELAAHLREFAAVSSLLVGPRVVVLVTPDADLGRGQVRCASVFAPRTPGRIEGVAGTGAKGKTWDLDERTAIGRSADCDIRLEDVAVSRHHAEVVWQFVAYELRDLASQNGSYVRGQRVRRCLLGDGDLLEFGLVQLRLCTA